LEWTISVEQVAGTQVSSAPAKIILFGEHGVNRQQPALATAVDLRTYCRVAVTADGCYRLQSGKQHEVGELAQLQSFKDKIDKLRAEQKLDEIRETARDFFAPARYVLAYQLGQLSPNALPGLDIVWRSTLPIGSGLGSGAAATTSMVQAISGAFNLEISKEAIVQAAWQGDIIAHGGVASSLDSSTATYGGLIRYTVARGAELLPTGAALSIVIGDTRVQHNTAALNTHVRRWLEEEPVRMHHFRDMGWIVHRATTALQRDDHESLGNLMNLHQLLQEKLGTSVPEAERLINAALEAGALGAKISGSGGGGIIIALVEPERMDAVATAIGQAGGRAYKVTSATAGVRLEDVSVWDKIAGRLAEDDAF
jgi:mevalonate kinase